MSFRVSPLVYWKTKFMIHPFYTAAVSTPLPNPLYPLGVPRFATLMCFQVFFSVLEKLQSAYQTIRLHVVFEQHYPCRL